MTFIEVDPAHQRKGIGARLYKKARHDVGKLGCRLLPHPDLTWDGFYFWMSLDPKALLEVLSLESSRGVVEQEGGDVDRFVEQLRLVTLRVAETKKFNFH
jgi:GNAT superfamily N-acetyltransferase